MFDDSIFEDKANTRPLRDQGQDHQNLSSRCPQVEASPREHHPCSDVYGYPPIALVSCLSRGDKCCPLYSPEYGPHTEIPGYALSPNERKRA